MMVLEGSPAPSCALDVAWSLGMVPQCGDAQEAALLGVAPGPAARHSNTFMDSWIFHSGPSERHAGHPRVCWDLWSSLKGLFNPVHGSGRAWL